MSRASSVPAHHALRATPLRGDEQVGRRRPRWRRALVGIAAMAMGIAACGGDAESETIALPPASGSAVSIVDAEPADGPGIDLGSASEAVNRGQRPGGDGDATAPSDTAASDTEPSDTEPSDTEPSEPEPAPERSEDTEPADTAPAEDTEPSDANSSEDTAAVEDAEPSAGGPGRLGDDSPTCLIVTDLISQRDEFNGLFVELGAQLQDATSLDEATVIFESIVGDVVTDARVVLDGVERNYRALADEQPRIAPALEDHFELLTALLDAYETLSGDDLNDVDAALAREVGPRVRSAGLRGRDVIDALTQEACGMAFRSS